MDKQLRDHVDAISVILTIPSLPEKATNEEAFIFIGTHMKQAMKLGFAEVKFCNFILNKRAKDEWKNLVKIADYLQENLYIALDKYRKVQRLANSFPIESEIKRLKVK
nr:MAG TPA: hypothetical protein [Bacteriophage sp.]